MVPARSRRRLAVLCAASGALVACGSGTNLSPTFTILRNPPPTPNQLSRQVALIADSHAHYLYGAPTVIQTNVADWFSASAIRPPQADLWGWRFLRWTLGAIHADVPIIHLGDVGDISCAAEFEHFLDEMTRVQARKRWVYAPGNHDGFFYGNYDGITAPVSLSLWAQACAGSAPLDKAGVVSTYLGALKKQGSVPEPDPGFKQFAEQFTGQEAGTFAYRRQGTEWAYFQRAAWHVRHDERWGSWIAQEVDLSWSEAPDRAPAQRVYAIVIDSAAYTKRPELLPLDKLPILGTAFAPNAGLRGDIPPDELAVISEWLADAKRENALVFIAAHHPLSALTDGSRAELGALRAKYGDRVILYASAHDHGGKWIVNAGGATQWLELNVGSLLDSPMEFRYLQVLRTAPAPERVAVYAPLRRLSDLWKALTPVAAPHCDDHVGWEPIDAAFPIGYKQVAIADVGKTEAEILKVLLASLDQEVKAIPSADPGAPWPDPPGGGPHFGSDAAVRQAIATAMQSPDPKQKMDLIQSLAIRVSDRFPDETTKQGRDTRDWEMCQVMWGTKYERAGARKPDPSDTTVILPTETP